MITSFVEAKIIAVAPLSRSYDSYDTGTDSEAERKMVEGNYSHSNRNMKVSEDHFEDLVRCAVCKEVFETPLKIVPCEHTFCGG